MGSRLEKNSKVVRKLIENHVFDDEDGEEYGTSKFCGVGDYIRRKKIKLQNLDAEIRSASVGNRQIFKGIVAHVNGYTQPSLNDLHQIIVSHGGGFLQYLDGKTSVTHIITANLTLKKAVEFRRYRIVKPAWVVESLNAGRLLPWENYRVIDEGPRQRLISFNDGKVVSQDSKEHQGYREQMSNSWYASQFKGFDEDLDDDVQINAESSIAPTVASRFLNEFSESEGIYDERANTDAGPGQSSVESFGVSSSLESALKTLVPSLQRRYSFGSTTKASSVTGILEDPKVPGDGSRPESLDGRSAGTGGNYLVASKDKEILTAEKHNALLLADHRIRNSSTGNPDFLKQYYSESRLHHLSTWKADLKARIQQIAADKSPSQKQAQKGKPGARRYIMHVDFDSFFCAVSLKNAPEYTDKPAVVAHGSGTGSEIASCNYPARAFGVKNGMWMKTALQLCPTIKVLPYDFPAYEEASRDFYKVILDIGGIVQSVSVDEALVDITSLCLAEASSEGYGISEGCIRREQEKADEVAQALRKRIKEITGCEVSVGIGGNILLAKVALRRAKPAGQYQMKPEGVLDFIGELTVQDLPGVAYSIGGKLERIGVKFVKDIRSLTKERLAAVLGPKTGERIWNYSRGIDQTEVGEQTIRKSISAEVNWGIRFISQPEAEEFVKNLCEELHRRLLDNGVKGHQLTMKIMRRARDAPLDPPKHLGHGKCDTFNKSVVLGVPTHSAEILGREAITILRSYGFSPGELRGLGVQMTKLEPLKPVVQCRPESSQKQIAFTAPTAVQRQSRKEPDDPIVDPASPTKAKTTPVHPAAVIARANAKDESAKKALNLMGTQFLFPESADRMVLTNPNQDVRLKSPAQSKSTPVSRGQSPTTESRFHNQSALSYGGTPIASQLDPDVFDALPEDIKAEVLASYPAQSTRNLPHTLLPQSPRKTHTITTAASKKNTTPTKRLGSILSRGHGARKDAFHPTLTQSNFIATTRRGDVNASERSKVKEQLEEPESLDPGFLAALPEDVRAEVVAEFWHERLAQRSSFGLSVEIQKKQAAVTGNGIDTDQRTVRLAPRPPRPTFTTAGLCSLPELRETLSAWHKEFTDEGPHSDDVAALERYLRRVVLEERDMAKAVAVVRWVAWLVEDADRVNANGQDGWEAAVEKLKEKIQEAVSERGLGRVAF